MATTMQDTELIIQNYKDAIKQAQFHLELSENENKKLRNEIETKKEIIKELKEVFKLISKETK